MDLQELVDVSTAVSSTRKRLEKIDRLASLLGRLEGEEIEIGVGFLTGEVRQGRIGIGPAAVREVRSVPSADAPSLSLRAVDAELASIAELSGPGSSRGRVERLGALMRRATADEQRFLGRLLIGELRQGALEGVMAEAVARATDARPSAVRRALMLAGDLRAVAVAVLSDGPAALERFDVALFRPLQPMLAAPSDDVDGALSELVESVDGEAALEWKLDGARVQVHKDGDEVKVYSRRLHEVTAAVPEVVELARSLPAERLILDGETIALHDDDRPRPFQETMRRFGRRLDVGAMRSELPLSTFLFDLLWLDGQTLIDEPWRRRVAHLDEIVPASSRTPRLVTADADAARAFVADAIRRGHEGAMAKAVDSPYAAGQRGGAWRKLKPSHTLDLVILAAEWGSGRRKGWLSNLHLGARDVDSDGRWTGGFVMLGKTFKGLTDAILTWQTEQLLAREIGRDRHTVHVRPELVAEIAFNDVQASPRYPGGLALRFARVKRYRDDKTAAEADTIETVRGIYAAATGLEPPAARPAT